MIQSMTGFGRGTTRSAFGTITVELRSVNHRFLEIVPHVPAALQPHEERLRESLRQQLRRGRVTCTVTLREAAGRAARVTVNDTLARRYHQHLTRLARRLRLAAPTLEQLLTLPRVVTVEGPEEKASWWLLLERAVQQAITRLKRMRAREGRATAQDLLRRAQSIERDVHAIAARAPALVSAHHARLTRRLQELAPDVAVDPQRVAAEVALFAANADVAEELARLRSHLAQLRRAVQASGEQGRALDFIAQEMFREANTIGSKANDYAVTSRVIAIKGALEKIREQIQNVE